ncbi:hypothetical protein BDBG_07870 [Blastomyces gilchristii SLH14081]|uniref:Uncharacterized protein n=1 Tax=Blastomyces gilchristii (strain SLH14081) TaxID=559298 RepID=A0A179UXH7_BLAGS|nr:uncharacterized protein BDBG_07870 [Blastomyces gilchristii SLH14081]OAT12540.1 hypothetical protein BDBG_07870 [Blastomyces gilchristii SLH14081]
MSVGTSHVAGLRRSITETGPRPWDLQMVLVSEVVHRFLEPWYRLPLVPVKYLILCFPRATSRVPMLRMSPQINGAIPGLVNESDKGIPIWQ